MVKDSENIISRQKQQPDSRDMRQIRSQRLRNKTREYVACPVRQTVTKFEISIKITFWPEQEVFSNPFLGVFFYKWPSRWILTYFKVENDHFSYSEILRFLDLGLKLGLLKSVELFGRNKPFWLEIKLSTWKIGRPLLKMDDPPK